MENWNTSAAKQIAVITVNINMTTLIPSYSSCISRMTAGERRFAQRLEAKLEDDYLCWYDIPIGQSMRHPDFIVLHPKRGLLILEVKDWKRDSIQTITKTDVTLLMSEGLIHKRNPLEQARQYAEAVADMLQRDPQLVFSSGKKTGTTPFPLVVRRGAPQYQPQAV